MHHLKDSASTTEAVLFLSQYNTIRLLRPNGAAKSVCYRRLSRSLFHGLYNVEHHSMKKTAGNVRREVFAKASPYSPQKKRKRTSQMNPVRLLGRLRWKTTVLLFELLQQARLPAHGQEQDSATLTTHHGLLLNLMLSGYYAAFSFPLCSSPYQHIFSGPLLISEMGPVSQTVFHLPWDTYVTPPALICKWASRRPSQSWEEGWRGSLRGTSS